MYKGAKVAENTGAWWSYTPLQLIPSIQPLTGTRGRSLCTYVPRHGDTFVLGLRCRMDSKVSYGRRDHADSGVAWIAKCRTVGGSCRLRCRMDSKVSYGPAGSCRLRCRMDSKVSYGRRGHADSGVAWIAKCRTGADSGVTRSSDAEEPVTDLRSRQSTGGDSGVAWIAKCRTVGGVMPTQVSHG